jgi:hypothetical protein
MSFPLETGESLSDDPIIISIIIASYTLYIDVVY